MLETYWLFTTSKLEMLSGLQWHLMACMPGNLSTNCLFSLTVLASCLKLGRNILSLPGQSGAHRVEVDPPELLVQLLLGGEGDSLVLWQPHAGTLNTKHLIHEPLIRELCGEGGDEVHPPV